MIVPKENKENAYSSLWIENRILFCKYKPEVFIDLEAARIIVADRISLQKGKTFPVLCFTEGIFNSDKAGRDYLSIKGTVLTKAIAYLAPSTVSLAMLHFFTEKNEPSVPSRIFTEEKEAIKFLQAYTH